MTTTPSGFELGLPVIEPNKVLISTGKGGGKDLNIPQLIAQSLITTFIFLIIIIWFTLALNSATRESVPSDYLLFQFAVYFTIIAIILILFVIVVIFEYRKNH